MTAEQRRNIIRCTIREASRTYSILWAVIKNLGIVLGALAILVIVCAAGIFGSIWLSDFIQAHHLPEYVYAAVITVSGLIGSMWWVWAAIGYAVTFIIGIPFLLAFIKCVYREHPYNIAGRKTAPYAYLPLLVSVIFAVFTILTPSITTALLSGLSFIIGCVALVGRFHYCIEQHYPTVNVT